MIKPDSILRFRGPFHWCLVGLLSLVWFGAGLSKSEAAETARLQLELVAPGSQERIPGWFRVLDAEQQPVSLPELYSRGTALRANHPARRWYAVMEPVTLSVPKGEVYIEAFSGLNSERVRRKLDFRFFNRLSVKLPIPELRSLKADGWWGGNTHLHLKGMTRQEADDYLRVVPRGDRLDLLFVSHLERVDDDASYISNEYTRTELQSFSQFGVLFDNGEEHRHNFGPWKEGYGHVMFLSLPELVQPVSIGKGITGAGFDSPNLGQGIEQARALGATVIWCHNGLGFEDVPNWVSGRIHAQNIFDGGNQGAFDTTFYKYLDIGMRVPFSTGTDWFQYDFSRVYVQVEGKASVASWLRGLRKGRSFISNGPLLQFTIDGVPVGTELMLDDAKELRVEASVVGRHPFGAAEVIANGRVIARVPAVRRGRRYEARLDQGFRVTEPTWFALRIGKGADGGNVAVPPNSPRRGQGENVNEMGEALFAHSSPIYVGLQGRNRFDPDRARELISEMEVALMAIEENGLFESVPQREAILEPYRASIAELQKRLAAAKAR